jgi:serine/threonine protein kinase
VGETYWIIYVMIDLSCFFSQLEKYSNDSLALHLKYLEFLVDEKVKNEAAAKHIFRQVVCAVEYLHSKMISHRDIKPVRNYVVF